MDDHGRARRGSLVARHSACAHALGCPPRLARRRNADGSSAAARTGALGAVRVAARRPVFAHRALGQARQFGAAFRRRNAAGAAVPLTALAMAWPWRVSSGAVAAASAVLEIPVYTTQRRPIVAHLRKKE